MNLNYYQLAKIADYSFDLSKAALIGYVSLPILLERSDVLLALRLLIVTLLSFYASLKLYKNIGDFYDR